MLVSSLAIVAAVYGIGLTRLWRTAGYGRGVRPFEAMAFGLGWLALVAALSPSLDEWSEQLLAAHMVQHELLMVVAAPLMTLMAMASFPVIISYWRSIWLTPDRVFFTAPSFGCKFRDPRQPRRAPGSRPSSVRVESC